MKTKDFYRKLVMETGKHFPQPNKTFNCRIIKSLKQGNIHIPSLFFIIKYCHFCLGGLFDTFFNFFFDLAFEICIKVIVSATRNRKYSVAICHDWKTQEIGGRYSLRQRIVHRRCEKITIVVFEMFS